MLHFYIISRFFLLSCNLKNYFPFSFMHLSGFCSSFKLFNDFRFIFMQFRVSASLFYVILQIFFSFSCNSTDFLSVLHYFADFVSILHFLADFVSFLYYFVDFLSILYYFSDLVLAYIILLIANILM